MYPYHKRTRNKVIVLILAIVAISLFLTFTAKAQSRQTVTQYITWVSINSNIKVAKKLSLASDGQFRFVQDLQSMQHMLRLGASIDLTSKLSIVPVGYSYIWNYKYGKQPAGYVNNEHRIWQQVLYKHKIGRVAINHRLRVEERFLQAHSKLNEGTADGDQYSDYQWRARYRIQANIPLNNKTMDPKTFYISIWDEFFTSWGGTVTYNKLNQNRIFVGPGYQISKSIGVQAGPFYQDLIKSNGAKQENNIGFLIQLNHSLDLSNANKTKSSFR